MTFVLDASVALAWILGERRNEDADAALERLKASRALVPALWVSEIANGVLAAVRRGRLAERDAEIALQALAGLPIDIVPPSLGLLERTYRLGAELGLTTYDATYLDLAVAARCPLATLDADLRRAARSRKVPLMLR